MLNINDIDTLDATAIAAPPGKVNSKNRLEAEKKLKSNCTSVSEMKRKILKARKPVFSIKTKRYPRVLTNCKMYLKESETSHTSEDCFTEENKKIVKHWRNFKQSYLILLTLPKIFEIF